MEIFKIPVVEYMHLFRLGLLGRRRFEILCAFNVAEHESQKQDGWHCGQNAMALSLSLRLFVQKTKRT